MERGGAARNHFENDDGRPDRTPERDRRTEATTAAEQKKAAKPVVTEATIYDEMRKDAAGEEGYQQAA